jgi:hypothetical protein
MARQQTAELDPYEGLRTRARWKRAEAGRVLSDWRQSGESMTGFARRHGLGLHRLHYWREQLGGKVSAVEAQGVRLVPAVLRRSPPLAVESRTAWAPVCVVTDGVRVELSDPQGTDPQWVAALVSSLRGARA